MEDYKLLLADASAYEPIRMSIKSSLLDLKTVTDGFESSKINFCITSQALETDDFGYSETPDLFESKVDSSYKTAEI
ncbi:MAG: hypothetical protein AAB785_00245, partial [Patescibacteria group bacterium]